jgi:hypothetical protein
VIDVVPVAPGTWLARCECDATATFPDAAAGWAWVLGHACEEEAAAPPRTVDLTDRGACTVD